MPKLSVSAHKASPWNYKLKRPTLSPLKLATLQKQQHFIDGGASILQDQLINQPIENEGRSHHSMSGIDVKDIGGDINAQTKRGIDDFLATDPSPEPSERGAKMLSQSLLQRREWGKNFNLENKILFDLYSEFQSMINIAKKESETEVVSIKKNPMNGVLPVDANQKMSTLLKTKMLS